jgi:CheY-like chemotaxis protein
LPGDTMRAVRLQFAVRDTGIGIPADRLDRLFKDFSQVDASTTRRFGGTGLGLAISRRLAELHGGKVWVESKPGQGSCFQFTLLATPADTPCAAAAAQPIDASFAATHPARVLVVEDSLVNQKIVLKMLQKIGYAPALAGNGHEALAVMRERDFDVVLMDVEMPGLDGPETTRQMRAECPAARQPMVVALTAHAIPGSRERFLAAGMDDYLAKPLRLAELSAVIARCAELKRSRGQPR